MLKDLLNEQCFHSKDIAKNDYVICLKEKKKKSWLLMNVFT